MKPSPLVILGLLALAQGCGGSGGPSKVNRDIVLGAFYDTASDGTYDPRLVRNLPLKVDLSADLTPVKDQSNRGTCTFFSSMALVEATIKKDHKREVNLSEEYLSAVTKEAGYYDDQEGSFSNLNIDQLIESGALLESDWPYRPSAFDKGFPCEAYANHKSRAPRSCFYSLPPEAHARARLINGRNLGKVKLPQDTNELIRFIARERRPVIVGLPVNFNGWGNNGVIRHGEDLRAECLSRPSDCGMHEVLIYGYDLSRKIFYIKNSWGKSWGKNGLGEIDINSVDKYAIERSFISLRSRAAIQIPQDQATQEASLQSFAPTARETVDGEIQVTLNGQIRGTTGHVFYVSSGLAKITKPGPAQESNTEMIKLSAEEEEQFGESFVRLKFYENIDGDADAIAWNARAKTIDRELVNTTAAQALLTADRSKATMRTTLFVHTDTEKFKVLRRIHHPLEKPAPKALRK
jgi:hypothetical protein